MPKPWVWNQKPCFWNFQEAFQGWNGPRFRGFFQKKHYDLSLAVHLALPRDTSVIFTTKSSYFGFRARKFVKNWQPKYVVAVAAAVVILLILKLVELVSRTLNVIWMKKQIIVISHPEVWDFEQIFALNWSNHVIVHEFLLKSSFLM